MRPTFYGLEIAKTGLFMSQKNLDVTGHNIANAETPGYTRQRLVTADIAPYNRMTRLKNPEVGKVGAGVEAVSLDQIRNVYLDRRIRNHNSLESYWSQRDMGLGEIEAVVNGEIGDNKASLNQLVSGFFNAFNRMCIDEASTDKELRINLLNAARSLTDGFHDAYTRFEELQKEYDMVISLQNGGLVAQVNKIIDGIVEYNREIYAFEQQGEAALDLRDQRNLLLDELSKLVDIDYYEDTSNKLHVSVGGREIIYHSYEKSTVHMKAVKDAYNSLTGEYDLHSVQWEDGGYVSLTGGRIKSYLDLRDGVRAVPSAGIEARNGISQYIEMLNEMARMVTKLVNDLHVTAFNLPTDENDMKSTNGHFFFMPPTMIDEYGQVVKDDDGNPVYVYLPNTDPEVRDFDYSHITAKNISLSFDIDPDLGGSVYNISISSVEIGEPFNSLDNEKAQQKIGLEIVALGLQDSMNSGAIMGNLIAFLGTIGSDKQIAAARAFEYQSISYELQQMWASYSGVSNDEEMTNLIRFNHAYTAASRNITALDEQLDVLINRTGRVGL